MREDPRGPGERTGREELVAEFDSADRVLLAAKRLRELGFHNVEAYTPYPIPRLEEYLGVRRTRIPVFVLFAGITGATVAYLILWWTNSVDYPLNVGGRPYNGIPGYVPIIFETTVLFASATSFLLALLLSGLPRLYHPVFELDGFERTSIDRFWLAIGYPDLEFPDGLEDELARIGAVALRRVRIPS